MDIPPPEYTHTPTTHSAKIRTFLQHTCVHVRASLHAIQSQSIACAMQLHVNSYTYPNTHTHSQTRTNSHTYTKLDLPMACKLLYRIRSADWVGVSQVPSGPAPHSTQHIQAHIQQMNSPLKTYIQNIKTRTQYTHARTDTHTHTHTGGARRPLHWRCSGHRSCCNAREPPGCLVQYEVFLSIYMCTDVCMATDVSCIFACIYLLCTHVLIGFCYQYDIYIYIYIYDIYMCVCIQITCIYLIY